MTALYIIGWLACGVVTATGTFAYIQQEFALIAEESRREDLCTSWMIGLIAGPLALIVTFALTGAYKHGFKWR